MVARDQQMYMNINLCLLREYFANDILLDLLTATKKYGLDGWKAIHCMRPLLFLNGVCDLLLDS